MFLDRFSKPEKQPSRRNWGDSFATMSSLPPNHLVPEFAEVGVIGQTRVTNHNNYLNSLHIGGRLINLLKSFQFWQYKSVPTKSNGFWFAVFSQKDAMSTKSDHRQILRKFNVFRWPSQYSTLLKIIVCKKNIPSCPHGDFYRRDLEKFPFLMDVICSPSCTVAALALRSLSVVCLSRQNKILKFKSFQSQNGFCYLPPENAACEQFTYTNCYIQMSSDNAFTFNFPIESWSNWYWI